MGQVVSIQSYRGGTGKSNLAANLAVALADLGKRVAVLDADLQSPGVHLIFGFDKERLRYGLSDCLQGKCELEDVAYDVSESAGLAAGSILLLPSSMSVESVMRVISEGYDVAQLSRQFAAFVKTLGLDFLILDTHPGLNKETLLTTAVSHALLVLVRPDRQDFHGTAVLLEVAARLKAPRTWLVLNKVFARSDADALRREVSRAFDREIAATLPLCDEMTLLGSEGLMIRRHPDHPFAAEVRALADRLARDGGA